MKQKKTNVASKTSKRQSKKSIDFSAVDMPQLIDWAHEGTKDSLDKLTSFIIETNNTELREFANIAYGEAEYFYYSPKNKQEERDLELAFLIHEREEHLIKLLAEADRLSVLIKKDKLEQEIYDSLMKKQNTKKKVEWQYRYMGDIHGCQARLQEVEEDIEYESAWLKEALGMMKTKRYENLPESVFEHMRLSESGSFWIDDMGGFAENCCDISCPHCGSHNTVEIDDQVHPVGNFHKSEIEDIPF